jgi:hypothetical protein
MIFHHDSAIRMANDAWAHAGDPRLRLFAYQVPHAPSLLRLLRTNREKGLITEYCSK